MKSPSQEIAKMLQAVAHGDEQASESLFLQVYDELHRLASDFMKRERANHTLQPTALINEAFLKLTTPSEPSDSKADPPVGFRDLDHFIATAAVVMRHVLVNHANAKKAKKRGGGQQRIQLDDVAESFGTSAIDLIALDEALKKLEALDSVQHQLVELRFFGGMTTKQCAKQLGISERAVYYEWAHARAWLKNEIDDRQEHAS